MGDKTYVGYLWNIYIYICGIFMNNVEQLGGDDGGDERIEEPGGHAGENGTTLSWDDSGKSR